MFNKKKRKGDTMRLFKFIVLIAFATSFTLSWTVIENVAPQSEQLAAKKAYDSLIKPLSLLSSKNQRIKDLEGLGALIIKEAIERIEFVIERVLGKDDETSKHLRKSYDIMIKGIDPLIPKPKPAIVSNALHWADGRLDRAIDTFVSAEAYTDKLLAHNDYMNKKTDPMVVKDRLNIELEAFDKRYTPVVLALKKLKKSSVLLDSLMELEKLYYR